MLLDARLIVLFHFGRVTPRRTTFDRLRTATTIRRGLAGVLEEFRTEGKVHYELNADGQFDGDTVIALCTTIGLPDNYKLTVLAPDEAGPIDDDGQPAWQVLVHGTPDPVLASEGFRFYAGEDFRARLRDLLYNSISSDVVDEKWPYIDFRLEFLQSDYRGRQHLILI